jgi:hypothetical protein
MARKNGNEERFLASFIHYAGNGYCPKKQRPILMLKDYCHLYHYYFSSIIIMINVIIICIIIVVIYVILMIIAIISSY